MAEHARSYSESRKATNHKSSSNYPQRRNKSNMFIPLEKLTAVLGDLFGAKIIFYLEMTLLCLHRNSLWFGWKFHLHLERNAYLLCLPSVHDDLHSVAISLAQILLNFLSPLRPSFQTPRPNWFHQFPPLFCSWVACHKEQREYLTPGPLCAKLKMAANWMLRVLLCSG